MTDTHRDNESRDVVTALSTAAQQLTGQQQGSETETLKLIVDGAVETIPGAEHAGVSLVHANGEITSAALSSDAVRAVDQLQVTYGEGPCVTALSDKHTVLVDDLEAESWRWPQFAPQAVASGVASMLSFQLFARAGTLGALNLYSGQRASFAADAQTLGGLFALHAATALGEAQQITQLHQALASRDVIGQAKGILMERFGLDAEQAFGLLIRSSQDSHIKLVEVARWLTSNTGARPRQE